MVDISFDKTTVNMLKNMLGKRFELYSCDPFVSSPSVLGIIGICVDGKFYKITSCLEPVRRFYHNEDVAVLRLAACRPEEIVSRADNGKMIDTPVNNIITRIDFVNDHETILHDADSKDLLSTKGIIFHLAGGNEISFEIKTWFSEMITIRRGYDLIKQFTPLDSFLEEWDDCEGYRAKCSREIIRLS